uniref:Uncharacterized protein n=1 Tax=Arion vulgaris TaxID=1028688 RepID=A0A0B6ZNW3_9EUPU
MCDISFAISFPYLTAVQEIDASMNCQCQQVEQTQEHVLDELTSMWSYPVGP